jgi:TolB-like protein/Tfp pilus assembly protein PilF
MKRCPECRRDYYDDSLMYCLDDGGALLEGPASMDEPATAILHETAAPGETPTRAQIHMTDHTAVSPTGTGDDVPKPRGSNKRLIVVPLLAILIVVAGYGGYRYFSTSGLKQIDSIAVMPFVNESGNAELDYLSDGMTEALIGSLSQLPNLNVKARSTVFRYKGKETDAKTIGKDLGVQAVLNGRVVQRADQLSLSLELIDTQTENAIWSDRYDRKSSDLVSLQNEIAQDVSGKLKQRLSGVDKQRLAKTYTTNSEAYRLYLQGRFYWNKREENDFRRAIEYFDQAIAIDPNYALAYAGLADAYALLSTFGYMPPRQGCPKALQYARQAMALDASLAEPHTTIAYVALTYDYDLAASELEFKRAIELNTNYATAHQWYAEMLTCSGRFDEALAEFHRALEIEPLSLPINWDLSRFFYMSRKYDESLAQHKKTIELDPGFARAHRTFSELYKIKGDFPNAVEERARYCDLIAQPEEAALIRSTFSKEGWPGLTRLVTRGKSFLKDINNSYIRAKAYLDQGDKDRALAELNELYENRGSSLIWLKVEPQLDPLRDDPRFKDLMRRLNLPE